MPARTAARSATPSRPAARARPKPAAPARSASRYSVHPGVAMVQDWIASLRSKTGRSLEEWLAHLSAKGPADEAARRTWLAREHGLGTNTAWWLAERSMGKGAEEDTPEGYLRQAEVYVREQYAGRKAGLTPIYEALLDLALGIGDDVRACPCKTIVPLYRAHVFAQIKPATNARIDLGLALGAMLPGRFPARLIDTGGFAKKDRITHRIEIGSLADIDAFAKTWMKRAYDLDAPKGKPPGRTPARTN